MTVTERFATSRYYCLMPVHARGGLTLTVHQRAYKKYFARIRSGLMTKAEFEVWSRQAAELRDAALERYARAENEEDQQRIAQEIAETLNAE